jgi:hypothetical protein
MPVDVTETGVPRRLPVQVVNSRLDPTKTRFVEPCRNQRTAGRVAGAQDILTDIPFVDL